MPSSADRLTSSALPSTFVRPSANSSEPSRIMPTVKASAGQITAETSIRLEMAGLLAAGGRDTGVGIANCFTGVLGYNSFET